ncbi:MAG: thiolase domain-containing protein [Chloroflexi bacterium]|nr:thiolase domain-containing protein [Chloroflexota bacterium]
MNDVVIIGIGQTPVGEHWELSLRTLAFRAIQAARREAGNVTPDAMYIANFFAPIASAQTNLGALLAENMSLSGIESYTVEAAEASGAAAFRQACLAVESGYVNCALVVGVEKCSDAIGAQQEASAAQSMDYDFEGMYGLTTSAQAALLMQRYLYQYGLPSDVLADFALLAHANAVHNPNAMYRKTVSREMYRNAGMISDPLNMFDQAPLADGAAAILLTRRSLAPQGLPFPLVKVVGSASVVDTLALHDRTDVLAFDAAGLSVQRACRQAGIIPEDIDLFELSDSFSIYAALGLEAAGFAVRGEGWKMARDGRLSIGGELPILTMGGAKARGLPFGAGGVYQLVEAVLQLRGQAGGSQVQNARRALVQTLGGPASTAVTHVLERE